MVREEFNSKLSGQILVLRDVLSVVRNLRQHTPKKHQKRLVGLSVDNLIDTINKLEDVYETAY